MSNHYTTPKSKTRLAFEHFVRTFSIKGFLYLVAISLAVSLVNFHRLATRGNHYSWANLLPISNTLACFLGWAILEVVLGFYLPKKILKKKWRMVTYLLAVAEFIRTEHLKFIAGYDYALFCLFELYCKITAVKSLTNLYDRTNNLPLLVINLLYIKIVGSCCYYIAPQLYNLLKGKP